MKPLCTAPLHALLALALFALALFSSLSGCSPQPEIPESLAPVGDQLATMRAAVDGEGILKNLKRHVAQGNRYYGAPNRKHAIDALMKDLSAVSDSVEKNSFEVLERNTSERFILTNIIARTNPSAQKRILFASHWDTRLWAEEDPDSAKRGDPIAGANDGTSGLVVLIELLRVLKESGGLADNVGVDIIFFDGEEFGRPRSQDYCQGSIHFAREEAKALWPKKLPIAAIVLDMVGDRSLTFKREGYSQQKAPWLNDMLWGIGRKEHPEIFLQERTSFIFDDHAPLQALGIPTILLIDYDYAPWHTHSDTPDRCSAESLSLVTIVLAELLLQLAKH